MSNFLQNLTEWFRHGTTKVEGEVFMERVARDGYKYIQGDHALIVQVEVQSGNPDVVIYSSTIDKWLPPYDQANLSRDEKRRVLENVCKFLDRRKITYIVQ